MSVREHYLRGGQKYDTSLTGTAIIRVADLLDIADSKTRTSVYPELTGCDNPHELAVAWTWAAVLIADMTEADSATLRTLGNAIRAIESEDT